MTTQPDHKPLSAKEIAEAKELCEKATPGPWHFDSLPDGTLVIEMPFMDGTPGWVGAEVFERNEPEGDFFTASFIAAARTGWPRALTDLERARELLRKAHALIYKRVPLMWLDDDTWPSICAYLVSAEEGKQS